MTHLASDTGDDTMARKPYHAATPKGFTQGAPAEAIRAEFGRVLQAKMVSKGWNQSALAKEASRHMPGKEFHRDNISHYVRGLTLPGPVRLAALAKALGCKPVDLLPVKSSETIDAKAPPLDARWLGDGTVWLRVNQAVQQDVALKILGLLGAETTVKK